MRKIISFLFIISMHSSIMHAQLTSFEFNRKLDKVTREDYYSIPLTPEIIANMQNSLEDLRIYNISVNDTLEVPFILGHQGDQITESPVNFELINDVTRLKCCSYVTLKMKKKMIINMIKLNVLENNFDKVLSIEGSNDNNEWFAIAEHLRITGFDNADSKFRSTAVRFPSAEYNYFRIKFDDDSSPKITVTDAYAFEKNTIRGSYDELAIPNRVQNVNKKQKTSEVVLDLRKNYMLSYITLKSNQTKDFYRNVNIYKSNGTYKTPKGTEEAWQMINSGVVISDSINEFALNNEHSSKVKIEIVNNDNQPIILDEIRLFSEKTELKAKLPPSENLYLAYGSKAAGAPVYDLIHFSDKIPESLSIINAGKEQVRAAAFTGPPGEPLFQNKKWLWIIIGSLIVLIAYFTISMLKKENNNKG